MSGRKMRQPTKAALRARIVELEAACRWWEQEAHKRTLWQRVKRSLAPYIGWLP